MPAKRLFAFGGKSFNSDVTLKAMLKSTKKKHPSVLLIPTAIPEKDPTRIWNKFRDKFEKKFKCDCSMLDLLFVKYSKAELRELIFEADLIYVSGGNTLRMVNKWKKTGVDKLLVQAWKRGIILAGESAGAICWHLSGHSDSWRKPPPQKWEYIRVTGLDLYPFLYCPHFGEERKPSFLKIMKRVKEPALAISNHCAIEYKDNLFRIHKAKKEAKAFLFIRDGKRIYSRELEVSKDWQPIADLFKI